MDNARRLLTEVEFHDDPYGCVANADAAVVVTEWESIRKLDLFRMKQAMREPVLIDLRNVFPTVFAEKLGFRISTIGRPVQLRQETTATNILHARTRQSSEPLAGARNLKVVGGSNETFDS